MIREIFLPEKIGSYYLFSKRIAGICVSKHHIAITIVRLQGHKIIIEQLLSEPIESGSSATHKERVAETIKIMLLRCGKVDEIRTSLSAGLAVFKKINLPFENREKIKLVVGFEVEPLLPFSLSQTALDFMVTKQSNDHNQYEILVAAIQNHHISELVELFEHADAPLSSITLDLIALYGLYKNIPAYAAQTQNTILLDINSHYSRLMFIKNGALESIRIIHQGLSHIAKLVGTELSISTQEATNKLLLTGLQPDDLPAYQAVAEKAIDELIEAIRFTIDSFVAQTAAKPIHSILLFGQAATIPGFISHATRALDTPCSLFDVHLLTENKNISIKHPELLHEQTIISTATALPEQSTIDFNLLHDKIPFQKRSSYIVQLIIGALLLCTTWGIIGFHFYLQQAQLAREINESRQEAIDALAQRFSKVAEEVKEDPTQTVDQYIETAEAELKREEETWSKFYDHGDRSYLKYLLELTDRIDKESLAFEIKQLAISDDIITLKARVKDHDALRLLEREFKQSKLFKAISDTQDPDFTMRITLAHGTQKGT